ncbi:hypothetical protein DFH27DRAFT_570609 [Peziza echinospora]|nr:hypothetical protein DFH27DRAFT_570609 [Peziza echinospora]
MDHLGTVLVMDYIWPWDRIWFFFKVFSFQVFFLFFIIYSLFSIIFFCLFSARVPVPVPDYNYTSRYIGIYIYTVACGGKLDIITYLPTYLPIASHIYIMINKYIYPSTNPIPF